MAKYILGISAFTHDAAAAVIKDGEIIAAAQEERFTRKKHDPGFPVNAISYTLREAGIKSSNLDLIALNNERFAKKTVQNKLKFKGPVIIIDHCLSHAASAFYPSPFKEAAILVVDGLGSEAPLAFGRGKDNSIEIYSEIMHPNSMGLLYSAFTYYCGFDPGSDEYKLMGLAPYGRPVYKDIIFKKLIHLERGGKFELNTEYFNCGSICKITNKKFNQLFGSPPRKRGSRITKRHADLARSAQAALEAVLINISERIYRETGMKNLCMAGDIALNCVANSRILQEESFKEIWIQPASSDAGCAIGTALAGWYGYMEKKRKVIKGADFQKMSFLGPSYSDEQIEKYLKKNDIKYEKLEKSVLVKEISRLLAAQKIIGWFQGRMEFGPRALGDRSILADPRSKDMRDIINKRVKFREPFRPFAPSVILEKAKNYFNLDYKSPYMLFVYPVKKSGFPAITHIDKSARVQTVDKRDNPIFYDLIKQFFKDTGCPMVINTSFNVMGEPIVCTPEEAYKCFMKTDMDYLVMGSFVISKKAGVGDKDNLKRH